MSETVWIDGVKCLGCGHEMTAREFSDGSSIGLMDSYPVPITLGLARARLWHPPGVGFTEFDGTVTKGCGGTLALSQYQVQEPTP